MDIFSAHSSMPGYEAILKDQIDTSIRSAGRCQFKEFLQIRCERVELLFSSGSICVTISEGVGQEGLKSVGHSDLLSCDLTAIFVLFLVGHWAGKLDFFCVA